MGQTHVVKVEMDKNGLDLAMDTPSVKVGNHHGIASVNIEFLLLDMYRDPFLTRVPFGSDRQYDPILDIFKELANIPSQKRRILLSLPVYRYWMGIIVVDEDEKYVQDNLFHLGIRSPSSSMIKKLG
jgi:hypothetical protein